MRRGFREVREIKVKEVSSAVEEEEAYKQIKPETDITIEECDAFWRRVFMDGGNINA